MAEPGALPRLPVRRPRPRAVVVDGGVWIPGGLLAQLAGVLRQYEAASRGVLVPGACRQPQLSPDLLALVPVLSDAARVAVSAGSVAAAISGELEHVGLGAPAGAAEPPVAAT